MNAKRMPKNRKPAIITCSFSSVNAKFRS